MMILEVSWVLTTLTRQLDSLDSVGRVTFRGWESIGFQNRFLRVLWEGNEGKGDRGIGGKIRLGMILDVRELRWDVARELARDRGWWRRVVKGGVDGRTPNTRHNRPIGCPCGNPIRILPELARSYTFSRS